MVDIPESESESESERSEYERLVAGDWYRYRKSPELKAMTAHAHATCHAINQSYYSDRDHALALFSELVEFVGEGVEFTPPFHIDYGSRIRIGRGTFINNDFVAIGGGEISIGTDVLIGPGARLYTPNHAIDPVRRREGYERNSPITIGDNVWLGGSVVICPGVTIGENSIVGAGSVVTKDIPANVVAAGNPARVLHALDD